MNDPEEEVPIDGSERGQQSQLTASRRRVVRPSPAARVGQAADLSVAPLDRQPTQSRAARRARTATDRKSTRLNSSHGYISYAVFCLKKKKKTEQPKNLYNKSHE